MESYNWPKEGISWGGLSVKSKATSKKFHISERMMVSDSDFHLTNNLNNKLEMVKFK